MQINFQRLLFLVICALLQYSFSFSQGSLQFNQAVILNNGTSYTVPAGKVWKVESAVYTSFNIGYSQTAAVTIDGTSVNLIPFSFNDGNSTGRSPYSTAFPMWLPAGTSISPSEKTSKMFVIEFNIIP